MFIQNLAPGAAARLGLSYEALKPVNDRLIVADISGYGDAGPFAQKKAYDLLIQAEAGLMSVTGTPEIPSRAGISAADIATGMYAQTAILAALVRRGRTGQGANVKIVMLDAIAEWMSFAPLPPRLRRLRSRPRALQPPGARPLRRTRNQGRPSHLRPAERPRMGSVLQQGARPPPTWCSTSGSSPTPPAVTTGPR